ncbi:hypothetical protein Pmar_PMAR013519 [Perkinsus marinus ATCC 50983]|uniref:Uncharacterized protein n=1 Tax=Perkinsus marinus (strain ATCC 50983 / TXsc) TaxID=423536 RepID=C5L608_PERM5|nr:hypothetical protein Pmar_PMAR013519 [Perkinsus marinus ATCC 50983]EER07834.1 hypothetical protein Pmar_PMAR013519 [Perkinsus marinus ATCC 50983]|eukprot:XP_002776018.1 hypothetical protein Pmar_PMAR013519 [Perkinsus marinus ATCC 50983]
MRSVSPLARSNEAHNDKYRCSISGFRHDKLGLLQLSVQYLKNGMSDRKDMV